MPKFLFHTTREFICYATEYYHSPNNVARAKLLARHIQLDLTPMSSKAIEAADRVVDLLLDPHPTSWPDVKSALHTFAAYAALQLESQE